MVVRRGEVWWAELDEPRGSEPGYERPVVIIQTDWLNRSRIDTVLVLLLTRNLGLLRARLNVLVPRKASGLPQDSVANVSQVVTIDRGYFLERVGKLPPSLMNKIDASLRIILDL